jgi:hypothetical protein
MLLPWPPFAAKVCSATTNQSDEARVIARIPALIELAMPNAVMELPSASSVHVLCVRRSTRQPGDQR